MFISGMKFLLYHAAHTYNVMRLCIPYDPLEQFLCSEMRSLSFKSFRTSSLPMIVDSDYKIIFVEPASIYTPFHTVPISEGVI